MLLRLQQTTTTTDIRSKEDHTSSGFYESSASSSPKSKSNSPISSIANGVFSINMKTKIESSL
jgi:hypothetical protein